MSDGGISVCTQCGAVISPSGLPAGLCPACLLALALADPADDLHPTEEGAEPPGLLSGSPFGPFTIDAILGKGGMSMVYRAHEAALDRVVALKVPREFLHHETFARRFRHEARVVAALEHPNIVPVYATGVERGIPWMSMRLMAGGSLRALLGGTQLDVRRAAEILHATASALDYAHERGIVHRDVKPSNILLDREGRVYVSDFGLAHLMHRSPVLTGPGVIAGTPLYMSPEQGLGRMTDHRADIYSLGVVAYEMLAGRPPYEADSTRALVMKHLNEPFPVLPEGRVPETVIPVLCRALAKEPADRWPSATAFATAFAESVAPSSRSTGLCVLTPSDEDQLAGDIVRAVHEAVDLEDFGSQVMPIIERLFDTSTSLLYWCDENRRIIPLAGGMVESIPFYTRHYFAIDLLQENLLRFNPWMLHGASMPNWKEYLSSPAYNECATRNSIDNFLHLRLNDCDMYDPCMVGIMVARTFRQADFSERERMVMGNLLPAFEAFARRNMRLEGRLKAQPILEALFEYNQRPTVVLDYRGGFLWASERADALFQITRNGRKNVPEALGKAAFEMAKLLGKKPESIIPPAAVQVPRTGGTPIHVDLRLVRNRNGAFFIVAELEDPETSPHLMKVSSHHDLTNTETQVLHLLSYGLSDRHISRRLSVSEATVHSHVNDILAKLDVRSRVEAALIANGRKIS